MFRSDFVAWVINFSRFTLASQFDFFPAIIAVIAWTSMAIFHALVAAWIVFDATWTTTQIFLLQEVDFMIIEVPFVDITATIINFGETAETFRLDLVLTSFARALMTSFRTLMNAASWSFECARWFAIFAVFILLATFRIGYDVAHFLTEMIPTIQFPVALPATRENLGLWTFQHWSFMATQTNDRNFCSALGVRHFLHFDGLRLHFTRQFGNKTFIFGHNYDVVMTGFQTRMATLQNLLAHLQTFGAIAEMTEMRLLVVMTFRWTFAQLLALWRFAFLCTTTQNFDFRRSAATFDCLLHIARIAGSVVTQSAAFMFDTIQRFATNLITRQAPNATFLCGDKLN